jgi:hypothetical protein
MSRVSAPSYAGRGRRLVRLSHPGNRRPVVQLGVLVLAALLGVLVGLALLAADRSSWSGARVLPATVTGRSDKGVLALAGERPIVLHLAQLPRPGTMLPVELSPDGRARPLSYKQTVPRSLRSGVLLVVGLALLVQLYRLLVTAPG